MAALIGEQLGVLPTSAGALFGGSSLAIGGGTQAAGGRILPFDRSQLPGFLVYGASAIAPHATTVRGTYTTPTGRLALLYNAMVHLRRAAVPTTPAVVFAQIIVYPNVPGNAAYLAHLYGVQAAVDTYMLSDRSVGWHVLPAGWSVEMDTQDASVGGSYDYTLSLYYTEFAQ